MTVLVTGGLGYIGSNTVCELLEKKNEVVVIDDLSNSSETTLNKIRALYPTGNINFLKSTLLDFKKVDSFLSNFNISSVIHFAGLKSVPESLDIPIEYYLNNISGTINLLKLMQKHHIYQLVFSSTAALYGNTGLYPSKESNNTDVLNPYSFSKLSIEEILQNLSHASSKWKFISLRYFNPVGSDKSNSFGDNPNIPSNIFPLIGRAALDDSESFEIYGNDYNTPDGSGMRDYIHIKDLALAHISALEFLKMNKKTDNFEIFNVGTGKSYSVFEVIEEYEKVSGRKINCVISDRRRGDIAYSCADVKKINRLMGWSAKRNLQDMCLSDWQFRLHINE